MTTVLAIPLVEIVVLALYYLILATLACYGLHRLVLVFRCWRGGPVPKFEQISEEEWPVVTVQLPLYNEKYVALRLIEAVCELDYPRSKLHIQVLDDSTDETRDIVKRAVATRRLAGFDIEHLHREHRSGFKAGALAAGVETARGELAAVFDADFVPCRSFLRQVVPQFVDPSVGMVQARWTHINRDSSLLTKAQAILLDAHFVVEHAARYWSGCFFNFNGTAGVWRLAAIREAGGWSHDTLTEDLDISYRAQLRGWRFVYLPDLEVPAELPIEINAFKSQQRRWAKGSIQTSRKLLKTVLRAKIGVKVKIEAFIHLTANWTYPLMVGLSILIFPAMVLRSAEERWKLLAIDLPLFATATGAVCVFFAVGQRPAGGWLRRVHLLPGLMGLGIGLAVNNTRAVFSGLFHDGGVFRRTPKYSIEDSSGSWMDKSYLLATHPSAWVELAFAAYFVTCFVIAIDREMWLSLPFLYLFLQGYCFMAWLTFSPMIRRRRSRGSGSPRPKTEFASPPSSTTR